MSDPSSHDSHRVLAALHSAGNPERSAAEAARRLAIDPEDLAAHYYRALALVHLDRLKEAKPHIRHLLRADPGDLDSQFAAVIFYMTKSDWRAARRHALEGLRIDPDSAALHFNIAIIYANLQNLRKARTHAARARELNPDHANYVRLCISLDAAHETSAADAWKRLAEYRAALALDPQNAALHNTIGDVLLNELEDAAGAEQHYRIALRTEPDNPQYQQDLFHSVAKRSLIYRVISIPSRTFGWLRRVATAIRYQPWRLIFLLIGFKFLAGFFLWLLIVTVVFWPAGKVYEWLLVSEIKRANATPLPVLRAWRRLQGWPLPARFALFLALNAGLWGLVFARLPRPAQAAGVYLAIVGAHFLAIAIAVVYRKIRVRIARWRGERRARG